MLMNLSLDMALNFTNITGIASSKVNFIYNVGSQMFGYSGLKRKKLQNFERLKFQADMCFFVAKLANFDKSFIFLSAGHG